MEIALYYMDIIVPVPYRYSTGSRGSVPVSAVRSSNPTSKEYRSPGRQVGVHQVNLLVTTSNYW